MKVISVASLSLFCTLSKSDLAVITPDIYHVKFILKVVDAFLLPNFLYGERPDACI